MKDQFHFDLTWLLAGCGEMAEEAAKVRVGFDL
jgi:hypothetical protein